MAKTLCRFDHSGCSRVLWSPINWLIWRFVLYAQFVTEHLLVFVSVWTLLQSIIYSPNYDCWDLLQNCTLFNSLTTVFNIWYLDSFISKTVLYTNLMVMSSVIKSLYVCNDFEAWENNEISWCAVWSVFFVHIVHSGLIHVLMTYCSWKQKKIIYYDYFIFYYFSYTQSPSTERQHSSSQSVGSSELRKRETRTAKPGSPSLQDPYSLYKFDKVMSLWLKDKKLLVGF